MSQQPSPPPLRRTQITNRVRAVMLHIPWYTIEGQRRLALDCGVSPSTISRLIRGETTPSYSLAEAVTTAISKRMGVAVEMRELFSTDSTYAIACVCDLTPWCNGCFPPEAFDDDGTMRPDYRDLRPGDWCRSRPMPTR